jgi:5'-nucleotidase
MSPDATLDKQDRPPVAPPRPAEVEMQILAFNDFHGQIEEHYSGLGGAGYLAAHFRAKEAAARNTVIISAGDLIGASPLTSALFHDEPTIEAANMMGVDFAVVGNHEFDEGWVELVRMQDGRCHPVDGCLDGDWFAGAEFPFLAANVVHTDTGETLFPAYAVKRYSGVPVGFIGTVLEGTPSIVTASGVEGLEFLDEADAMNAAVAELQAMGIHAIVAIIHEGGWSIGDDTCDGPIVDIVERTDDDVDVFISGHTHAPYVCMIDGRTVTGNRSAGRMYTEIDMTLNRFTDDVTSVSAVLHEVTHDVTPAADLLALVDKYATLAAPLKNVVIGSITEDITEEENEAGETALGDVIADAQLAETAPADKGGAVVAFMNPGGIRADFVYDEISGDEALGEITYGEAFTVQPFNNYLITMTLTGAQIDELLETQWVVERILQVSEGFSYEWSASAPVGSKVDIASIMIDGVPVDPAGGYRVTVNSFLADGGDGFEVLTLGTDRLTGIIDLDALVEYFAANSPVPPGPQDRITMIP